MELLQLRYFRTAAQLENFSKTAEQYMIPQSAVSATIRRLEKELGCELFDRQSKKVVLNENGHLLYEKVNRALDDIDKAVGELQGMSTKTIGIHVHSGIHFMSYLVPAFENRFHNYKIVYFQGKAIDGRDSDFSFVQIPVDSKYIDYRIIMEDEIKLAVSKKNRLAMRKRVSLTELGGEKFVGYKSDNKIRMYTDALCERAGLTPDLVFEADTVTALRSMVEADMGVALVPSGSWALDGPPGTRLIALDTHPVRQLAIAWKHEKLTQEQRDFLEFTCEWFKKINVKG